MNRPVTLCCTAIFGLMLLAAPAHADEEASNTPRVFTDEWGGCYAKSVPDDYHGQDGTTRVYAVQEGDDKLIATHDWYTQRIDMLCNVCADGTCGPVLVRHGPWARGHDPNDKDLALAFYHGDTLKKRYSTLDIAKNRTNASMSVSHYTVISQYKGFSHTQSGEKRYTIVTHDGRELTFDAATGAQIALKSNKKAELALFDAVRDKDKNAIRDALRNGAGINATVADEYHYQYSYTPLHFAFQTRDRELIKFLLEKGADIAARTHRGETVMSMAVQAGDADLVDFLLANGADPDTEAPYFGERMLHKAANGYNGLPIAKALKKHGADIEAGNEYGRTPLHTAAHSYQGTDVLEWLIAQGADINAESNFGEVPLHLAARYGNAEHVQILLGAGAKTGLRDNDGKTPLDYARKRTDKKPGIVKMLENAVEESEEFNE